MIEAEVKYFNTLNKNTGILDVFAFLDQKISFYKEININRCCFNLVI